MSAGKAGEPTPEIVAAVIAALAALGGSDASPERRSRWAARGRPGVRRWQPAEDSWLRRARLKAVERERGGDH